MVNIKETLHKSGLTITVQRRVILDEIKKAKKHVDADRLYVLVKKTLPRISVGTVYRNLKMLVNAGLIQKVERGTNPALYEINNKNHYHLICERCGKLQDLEGVRIDQLEIEIAKITGYQILDHKLEINGICPDCQVQKIDVIGA